MEGESEHCTEPREPWRSGGAPCTTRVCVRLVSDNSAQISTTSSQCLVMISQYHRHSKQTLPYWCSLYHKNREVVNADYQISSYQSYCRGSSLIQRQSQYIVPQKKSFRSCSTVDPFFIFHETQTSQKQSLNDWHGINTHHKYFCKDFKNYFQDYFFN